ncbi:MAG: leucine--tRNA ligase [Flavobacteriales bacterium]
MQYDPKDIERKWREKWQNDKTYRVFNDVSKPKYYVLDMFPYPSGAGLHVGHPLGYIASDIVARFKRHQGFNVLHPMGYDSFGLPAEQYAIQTGQHPAKTTEENAARYRQQLDAIGFSFDWDREVRTSDPSFYKWTQWIFIQLFESWYDHEAQRARPISDLIARFGEQGWPPTDACALTGDVEEELGAFTATEWNAFDERTKQRILQHFRLAYLSEAWVNWCPALGTVLANDEVKDGVSERGGHPVERKRMPQWSMRITAYAQRLIDGLDTLDWSESIKEAQRNWIGRSEGALVKFRLTPGPSPKERGGIPPSWAERPGYLTGERNSAGKLQAYARDMRKEPTEAEEKLWQELRGYATGGRIRRQHVIDRYIVDLVSLPKRLVIEVDGGVHDNRSEEDAARTERLNQFGFDVIRFTNDEVLNELPRVVESIKATLAARPDVTNEQADLSPSPSEKGLGDEGYFIDVFTTRPDTLFGVTFVTLAPEHELVELITPAERRNEVMAYVTAAKNRSERDRMADVKKVSGVFTGAYCIHPFTGKEVPVWVGDYVLGGYGTGAVMAVPGGDQRDWNFATHFGLPIIAVTQGADISKEADERKDAIICSEGFLQGLAVPEAITRAIDELVKLGAGERRINYRLRDAAFGRQRYWGEPIPIYYKDGVPYALPESELPLKLPEVDKFLPTEDGEPPLARASNWSYQGHPLETTTMPGWAGSSWYFLRYMDPQNEGRFASPEAIDYWQQIDLYVGGSEHATGHLLYFRFWTKFLHDRGYLNFDEPAKKLVNQGMITGISGFVESFGTSRWLLQFPEEEVERVDPRLFVSKNKMVELARGSDFQNFLADRLFEGEERNRVASLLSVSDSPMWHVPTKFIGAEDRLNIEGYLQWRQSTYGDAERVRFIREDDGTYRCRRLNEKMSKSKWNVESPDELCQQYGADTLRLYEMFLGPLEQSKPWDTNGIEGTFRFLRKFWNLFHAESVYQPIRNQESAISQFIVSEEAPTKPELKILHATLKKVTEDIEKMSFNTSVAQFMIAVNELGSLKCNKRAVLEPLVVALAPFAPHIAEELWQKLGHTTSITTAVWPKWDAQYLVEDNFSYPISFNGKTRLQLEFPIALDAKSVEAAVLANPEVQQRLEGKAPKKVIVVPKRIVNIVV